MDKSWDKSNGYEGIASIFIKGRGAAVNGIGSSTVRKWIKSFSRDSIVLDLGCGTGIPNTKIMIEEGMTVYGVDASPSMVEAFKKNFPDNPVVCEAAEDSSFFNRRFDVIVSWGLLFLLPKQAQETIILNASHALHIGGRFLFTSPAKKISWSDAMTDQYSISLGAERYRELLTASGFSLLGEFEDEGENHYYDSIRIQ